MVVGAGALGGPDVLGRREPVEHLAQHRALRDRDRELPVGEAFAVVPQPHRGALAGAGLVGLQQPGLVLVSAVGVDGLQDPAAQRGHGVRVVLTGQTEQVLLGQVAVVGVLAVQCVDRSADHNRLLGVDLTAGHRLARLLVSSHGVRHAHLTRSLGSGLPGDARQPRDQRARAEVAGQVEGLGLTQGAGLELAQPRQCPHDTSDHLGGLRLVERPGRHLGHLVEPGLQVVEEGQDRVCRSGVPQVPAHGSTQAPGADSSGRVSRSTRGFAEKSVKQ